MPNFPRTWLLIDVPFLCNRAFYALPGLSKGDVATQVVYGLFMDIGQLMFQYKTKDVCFCFDSRHSVRRDRFPEYKQKRRDSRTPEEEEARKELYAQITALRKRHLYSAGFPNVFTQKGYEADDIMASLARTLPSSDTVVMITADHDMYQSLAHNVSMYDPTRKSTMTADRLMRDFGVTPEQWALVKEIGGCKSDNIPAVAKLIGEGTAIKWVLGTLTGAKKDKIDNAPEDIRNRNRRLTRLPHIGTAKIEPETHVELTEEGWHLICDELGFGGAMRTKHAPFNYFIDTQSKRRKRGEIF